MSGPVNAAAYTMFGFVSATTIFVGMIVFFAEDTAPLKTALEEIVSLRDEMTRPDTSTNEDPYVSYLAGMYDMAYVMRDVALRGLDRESEIEPFPPAMEAMSGRIPSIPKP